jgi:two-component system, NarL family, sensor histidine kinase DesK
VNIVLSRMRDDRWHTLGRARLLGLLVWLAFILAPIVDAITNTGSGTEHELAITGTVLFAVAYVLLVLIWFDERGAWRPFALSGALLVLAIVLTVADRPTWGFLFIYVAACVGLVAPTGLGLQAVVGCAAIAAVCTVLDHGSGGAAGGYAASTLGVGLLLVLMRDLQLRNVELTEARAELARAAVAAERERIARDLHDLLGHTLSVITIKAELAGRLLPDRPDQASAEVADVEHVARQALGEVRQAVSGYRKPTLDGELEGARMALSAAGIDAAFERPPITLDPEVEAVLAWAVREGATNVIRHSGARHCQVRISAGLADAAVEVLDDGSGVRGANGSADGGVSQFGNGIAGLAERAERLRGRIEAGRLPEGGGFRLAVSVPTAVTGS